MNYCLKLKESDSIVLQVCGENNIHPAEFFGKGRDDRIVRVRRIAIKRLQGAGFSWAAISRLMKRHYTTILYWAHPEIRTRRRAACLKYISSRRAA